jgi:hypothetical protein
MKFSFRKLLVLVSLAFSVLPAVTQEDSARAAAPTHVAMAADTSRESAARSNTPSRAAQEPTVAVGEPSTYVLMLAGLALIGLMLLRRRND